MIENVYPLSHLQEGLYYHWLSSPASPAYFLQMSYRLKGALDIPLLQKSYEMLVERHAVLRTFFTQDFGEQVLQVVRKEPNPNFTYKQFDSNAEAAVLDYKAQDRAKGFNLQTGSQMRLSVLGLGTDTYEFIWSHHHIIMDGWCVGILMKEFFQVYTALLQGKAPELDKAYTYASYIDWLTKADKDSSEKYWSDYLSGFDAITSLPQQTAMATGDYEARESAFQLSAPVSQAIRELCKQCSVTENTFFQAVWGILLGKYNNSNDVVFGSIVSGRPAEVKGIEEMIGLFINTIPVRVQMQQGTSFTGLLKEVQQTSIEGLDHHYTQLAQIQAESELGQNLFDHLIQFQNFPSQEIVGENEENGEGSKGLSLVSSAVAGHNTYDFTCLISPSDVFDLNFMYNASRYPEAQIRQLQDHIMRLIGAIVANPNDAVSRIEYMSAAEKQVVLTGFNDTLVAGFRNKTLVELFTRQAALTPDHIAVVFEGKELTYRALDEQSNKLANYIRDTHNFGKEEPVGVMLERSESLIIAVLATFKAGAAYVPIDPAYPDQRKQYLLEDAGIKLLLTTTSHIFNLHYYSGSFFAMDAELDTLDTAVTAPAIKVAPSDLAYIIYTSGSTGQPKGVLVEHGSVANTIQAHRTIFNLGEGDRSLQFASPSFDASITQVFVPLISGGTLYIIGEEEKKDPALLEQYITNNNINFADIPPAYQKLMNMESIATMKKLGSGGEAAIPVKVNAFAQHGTYYNAYGPTEASICATMFTLGEGQSLSTTAVPIGKPIANTQVYILHLDKGLMPVGAAGQICIGGDGLARGYWKNDELTAEKFIANPFREGEKIYRTGDLGRWLPDGNIEFTGRVDDQVKIRGYRIELGEIENALRTHPDISAAVVMARINTVGDKELVAYIVPAGTPNLDELAEYMARMVPFYMMPSHYVSLEALPITVNGKVDKKKLPDPANASIQSGAEYIAPRNETEEKLVEIWKEILGKEKIGVRDDFFKLGGHSIKVVQLISRINVTFLVRIDIQSIFNDPTIENISEQIIFILEQSKQKENTGQLVEIDI
jgi:amino acid adenylation domain-containing protein